MFSVPPHYIVRASCLLTLPPQSSQLLDWGTKGSVVFGLGPLSGLKMIGKGFLQKVSKKQFRTVYYNANACG